MRDVEDELVHVEPEPEAVYADWGAARLLMPLFGALLFVALGGFVLYRTVFAPANVSDGSEAVADPEAPTTAPVAADPEAAAQQRAVSFASALSSGAIDSEPFAFEQPAEAQADLTRIAEQLGQVDLAVVAGLVQLDGDLRAAGPLEVTWTLEDGTVFTTLGQLQLVVVGTEWQVDWDPAVVHSGLTPGDVLVRERVTSPRAAILGSGGFELVGQRPVVQIGVVPRNVPSIQALADALALALTIEPGPVADLISRSPSDSVVAIAERRIEAIEPLRSQLTSLPGVVLTETAAPLAPYDGYGRAVLGRAGEVTAEILERSPDHFEVGDTVGRSGLQAQYNERLAGLPGFQVRIDRRFPLRDAAGQAIPDDADVNIVYLSAPQPPSVLQTTIVHEFQVAAEQALARTDRPSSLVAVRASTGEVLAVANGPGASVDNFALNGQYPPGSIFKIVTAYAALEQGVPAGQPVSCPATLVVDGREFRNAEGHNLGTVTFWDAFAQSCNTSFIEVGLGLDPGLFPRVAAQLGVGAEYRLGTAAFSGSVPIPGSAVERAATSFGQSTTLVSPLSMAVMAASVASGSYRPPTLIVDADSGVEPQQLNPAVVDQLRQMMAGVVNNGTGRALQGVPGGQVFGKTGTAEFGNEVPPQTHAWFVGYQGDVAFAVAVDGGGFGGSVAAPIAADFLTRIAGRE